MHRQPVTAPPRTRLGRLARRIDRATPADRDRVMDLVRVAAMFVVALGHWVMAVVWLDEDGAIAADSLLAAAPGTQWLTLALQVMGLFFAVGGWASARSLHGRDVVTGDWVHARARRLLGPATAYVAAVAVAVPVLGVVVGDGAVALVGRFLTVHLWFCAVVVPLYLLTPALFTAWRARGWSLLAGLVLGATAVDVAHRIGGLPGIGWLNFGLVWSAATVLGFAWADGLLDRIVARRLLLGGSVALAALIASPWLPLSMVGVPGAEQSNNSPPSVALVALTAVHVGAVVLATPALRRWLSRPMVWATVALAGRGAVTVYLWHLLGLVALVGVLQHTAAGALTIAPLSPAWWWSRPLWLVGLCLATAPLVTAALRFELRTADAPAPSTLRVTLAVVLAAGGCATLALHGAGHLPAVAAVLTAAALGRWLPRVAPRGVAA